MRDYLLTATGSFFQKKILVKKHDSFTYQLVRMSKTTTVSTSRNPAATREKLLLATVGLILKQGYAGTTVDEICAEAGVTKGSFFHHFENKEAIGLATADWWGAMGTALYAEAWQNEALDPLDKLNLFFEIMIGFTERPEHCTCIVGMLSQEMSQINPALRAACARHLNDWAGHVIKLLTEAKKRHRVVKEFDASSVAWFLNSLWQGSMLIGKTCETPAMIRNNLRLARSWVFDFFGLKPPTKKKPKAA
jgi:TetR/AcrR family transcriptional regulator, transcriptional repressor for nem operon